MRGFWLAKDVLALEEKSGPQTALPFFNIIVTS
jgi:hypothetical protein